jgi:hypothetical protein
MSSVTLAAEESRSSLPSTREEIYRACLIVDARR